MKTVKTARKPFKNLCTISRGLGVLVVNIAILELGPASNENPGNSTFYWGIHEF